MAYPSRNEAKPLPVPAAANGFAEVDLFLGSSEMQRLVPELAERGFLGEPSEELHPGVRLYTGDLPHVRYMKISEGCDHGCAFCAIPLMRGKHRSFALDEVVREAQLIELAAIVAQENFRSRFNTTFRLESAGQYCPLPTAAEAGASA